MSLFRAPILAYVYPVAVAKTFDTTQIKQAHDFVLVEGRMDPFIMH